MKNDDIIDTLNDLIRISHDGAQGFKVCAENARIGSAQLKALLLERSRHCVQAAEELSPIVHTLGGIPASGTTASGTLHRGWLNVKTAITGKSDLAVLEECDRGEQVAEAVYRKALAKNLPTDIRARVERQFQGLLKNHEMVMNLRKQAECTGA